MQSTTFLISTILGRDFNELIALALDCALNILRYNCFRWYVFIFIHLSYFNIQNTVGDEASETVVHRFLAADRLRESDAAGADAIDEDILRSLRPEIGVIDPFDRNAKQPHQTGRDGFRNQDLPHLHVGEHPRRAAVREEMDGYHSQCGASHRLRHTDEAVER